MLAGDRGMLMRIRHAGRNAWTNRKARMPRTASGYSGATGDEANAIRAIALIASTQRVRRDIGSSVKADIPGYRAFS